MSKFIPLLTKVAQFGAGLTALSFVGSQAMYVVPPGHRALHFSRFGGGILPEEHDEGINFVLPWFQRPHMIDVRTTPYVIRTDTGTKDLQTVRLTVRVLYAPELGKLQKLFTGVGEEFADTIFTSIGNEVLKAVVAQFDADELVTQREVVSQQIRARLRSRAGYYDLELKDISITALEFSPEYAQAIEAKQVEQQRVERQRYIVDIARQLKLASVIRVEGETEAARLISEAMMISPEFLELRRIEAAKDIARTLATSRNITYLPGGSGNNGASSSGATSNFLLNLQ
jgi:prohibitin 1